MGTSLFDIAKDLPPWVVLGLGILAGGLRSAWAFVYEHTIGYAITRISISLTVEDVEYRDAYVWLSCWVERHLRGRKVNSLLLRYHKVDDPGEPGKHQDFEMIPEYGSYYLLYKRRLMTVGHYKETHREIQQGRPMRSIRVQIWLCWNRNVLLEILDEARKEYERTQTRRIDFFQADTYGDWYGSTIAQRPISSVFHRPELLEDLIGDVEIFLHSKPLYQELGVPYRRGYLLAGPPGTGKSSLILAIASSFGMPIYLVPLRGSEMSGERLASLMTNCRKPSLVAFEDVDCLKVAKSRDSNVADGLTMADLLNVVDGIGASEDRVLFMTANHPESLDPALTRAGRVDRKFHIGYARDEELRRFYERLAQSHAVPAWPEFRASLPDKATIADAQALAFQGSRRMRRETTSVC